MAYNYGNFQNNGYSGQMYNTAVPMTQNYGTTPVNWNQPQPQYYQQTSYQNQPQMQQPQQNQPTGNTGFVWVQGEAGAKAYPVAAGNSVLLMDSEAPVLYMKSTDSSGRPLPIETYDLVKREPVSHQQVPQPPVQQKMPEIDLSNYVKNEDLEAKVMELIDKALGK